jgi:hypothetical protein
MGGGGEDAIKPCLEVLMSRGRKGGPREFLGIETVRRFLRRVMPYGQGAFNGLTPDTPISKRAIVGSRHLLGDSLMV